MNNDTDEELTNPNTKINPGSGTGANSKEASHTPTAKTPIVERSNVSRHDAVKPSASVSVNQTVIKKAELKSAI